MFAEHHDAVCPNRRAVNRVASGRLYPRVRLTKVNTSVGLAMADHFRIQAVPPPVICKDGREVARQSRVDTWQIKAWVRQHI